MAKKVIILLGSDSDRGIADKAAQVLDDAKVPNEVHVASAHRTPEKVHEIVKTTDADVFICIAGLSAALPGFVASMTKKPVIGVPKNAALGGLDSLLSIAQMPPGVPVACVGIDNGKNAGHLAIRILNLKYGEPTTVETNPSVTVSTEGSTSLPFGGETLPTQTSYVPTGEKTEETEENKEQKDKKKSEESEDWWPEGVKKV